MLREFILACGLSAATALSAPANSTGPIPPSQDPFYTAPPGFQSAHPGEVLRIREAPGNLTTVYNTSKKAYNVLYRTTDSNYMPTWGVTTLFTPKTTNGSQALLSYQIPYNAPNVDQSPSYALYSPTFSDSLIGDDIINGLSNGWAVNVPDFEGPLAAFGCAVQEGHATLDSVRAVLSLSESGLSTKDGQPPVALWGYSGGSIASEFAAELQVQYAPELKFAGAALGGLPTNLTEGPIVANKGYFAGLVPLIFLGWSKQHPDFNTYLHSKVKQSGPYNASTFFSITGPTEAFPEFAYQDMFQFFTNGEAFIQDPTVYHITNTDTFMGLHGVPQMPLFIYKAIADELAPIAGSDALVERYCQVGANIVYQKNTIGGHLAEEYNGDAGALAFLKSVLGGSYKHTGCTYQTVAQNVSDSPL